MSLRILPHLGCALLLAAALSACTGSGPVSGTAAGPAFAGNSGPPGEYGVRTPSRDGGG